MTWWAAGATVLSAVVGSSSARSASSQQADATQKGLDETARQYDQTREDYAPFREAGYKALGRFATENDTPLDLSTVTMDPGYEFARQQGQQAIDRKTAAAGGRISGAALKAASQYNTGVAQQGYGQAYERVNQRRSERLNRLAALANIGQTATNSVSAAGEAKTGRSASLISAQGDASAAATMAQGNIWGNAVNQLGAAGKSWAGGSKPYVNTTDYGGYGGGVF